MSVIPIDQRQLLFVRNTFLSQPCCNQGLLLSIVGITVKYRWPTYFLSKRNKSKLTLKQSALEFNYSHVTPAQNALVHSKARLAARCVNQVLITHTFFIHFPSFAFIMRWLGRNCPQGEKKSVHGSSRVMERNLLQVQTE